MGEVIDILSRREHLAAQVICLHCKHKWVAVVPVGVLALECPECSLTKGVLQGLVFPEEYYQCVCGNSHMMLSRDGTFVCSICGAGYTLDDVEF